MIKSLILLAALFQASAASAVGPATCAQARASSDVVFCQDFDTSPVGDWDLADLKRDFPGTTGTITGPTGAPNGIANGRTTIVSGGENVVSGRGLRTLYGKNRIGSGTGAQFHAPIGTSLGEAYIGYWVRFDPDIPSVKGGKIPGLVGGTSDTGRWPCCGRNMSKGLGYSTRMMFVGGRRFANYFYWMENPRCDVTGCNGTGNPPSGDGPNAQFTWVPGTWYFIEQRVILNTPATSANGLFEVWINGTKTTTIANTKMRGPGATFSTNKIAFETYLGGNDMSWWSPIDTFSYFDVVVVSRNRIGKP